jgi:hypothetical protein
MAAERGDFDGLLAYVEDWHFYAFFFDGYHASMRITGKFWLPL